MAAGELAYAAASARGARWQMASARYRAGVAARKLGEVERALAMLNEAKTLFSEVGDRGGKAAASVIIATVQADRGDFPAANAAFESALATYVEIGDRPAEATALHNLAVLSRRARDLPKALNYAGRAVALDLELGMMPQAANTMQVIGNLRVDMGDLSGGIETLTHVCDLRRAAKSPQLVSSLFALGTAELQRANFARVRVLLEEAKHIEAQEKLMQGRLRFLEAGLATAEKRYPDAIREGNLAAELFKQTALADEQAMSLSVVARAQITLKDLAAARVTLAPALAIVNSSKAQLARTPVLITDAMLRAQESPAQLQESLQALRKLQSELTLAGAQGDSWQARVALAELMMEKRQPGAKSALISLRDDAQAQGLLLYAKGATDQLSELK
jgi:hypothetical protein